VPEPAGDGLEVHLRQAAPIPLAAEFRCAEGELLAIVGPSGSGKTTILRAVAGLVFQHYALFPHLSAVANVASALGHLPPARRETRAQELLELVNLKGLERRRPESLSGGQQQRVALARALARDPAVLLLDEPFSAVDQVTRKKLRRELGQLRRQLALPIVLVTHDLEEAGMLADNMCVLHHGETLQSGPPFALKSRPASPLVARLLDMTNLYEGRVVEHRPEVPVTLMRWLDYTLEARYAPAFAPGEAVCWVIPPESVIVHRRDRPSRGERENPIDGVIEDFVRLGEITSVTARVGPARGMSLSFSVPTHVANRNRLDAGGQVRVSLLSEAIHLMPWESLTET